MNKTSNQLEIAFQEVIDYFATVSGITVSPGAGSPPEHYTITYNLTGVCKEEGGNVYSCDTHVISISLPFGFPHFPPNCLPESPTFHPDFDSSAICIGDAWEENKSIIQLILYIGRMIAGESYSKSNAFNEAAAEWYKTNCDQLPFDNTVFSQATALEPALGDEVDDTFDTIDTLDDNDFGESFSLELESPAATAVDTDQLHLMARQKRYHALARELKRTAEPFPGRSELESEVQNVLERSANLFAEAEELEHLGKQQEALDTFQAIEHLVSDFPMLQEAKARVQQAFDLLGDWVDGKQDQSNSIDDASPSSADASGSQALDTAPKQRRVKRTFFEDKKAVSRKWFFSAVAIGTLALTATLVLSYFSLSSSLEKAQKNYTECQNLLDKDDFTAADQKCEEALTLLTEVRIVKQSERKQLESKIKALVNSPKFKQGLAGNILLDGKYVSIAEKNHILAFKEAKESGDAFFQQERWHEASLSYIKALNAAKETEAIDAALLSQMREQLPHAQLKELKLAGEKALAASDWNGAADFFAKALSLARANRNLLPEDITKLETLSNQAEFNSLREHGHMAFKNSDWEAALTHYQRTLDLAGRLELTESAAIADLHKNIARTKIYMAIEKGKEAFAAAQWDEVIVQYEKAIILLKQNSDLLSTINTEKSGDKLSRIMLHAAILQDKQDLAKYLKAEEYKPALSTLQEIKQAISASKFARLPEFKTILKEVSTQRSETRKKLQIQKQSTYLTSNFKKLFLKHYPAAAGSKLSAPKVEFLKSMGSKLLFRMQCTEKAGGRPLRLQMDYLYSPANGSWHFYSEE